MFVKVEPPTEDGRRRGRPEPLNRFVDKRTRCPNRRLNTNAHRCMVRVAKVLVGQGERVEARQQVGTIEAMKMESAVRAPASGTNVEPGTSS